jgi:hypothetical protein
MTAVTKRHYEKYFMFQKGNRHSAVAQQQVTVNPVEDKHHVTSELRQLYKDGSTGKENTNSAAATTERRSVTSTQP